MKYFHKTGAVSLNQLVTSPKKLPMLGLFKANHAGYIAGVNSRSNIFLDYELVSSQYFGLCAELFLTFIHVCIGLI